MRFPNILALSLIFSVFAIPSALAQPYYQAMGYLHAIHHAEWKCHSNSTEDSCWHTKYCSWHQETCAAEKEEVANDLLRASPIGALVLIIYGAKL